MSKSTLPNGIQFRVCSHAYMGGGELSRHRTYSGALRFVARQDAAVRHLNRFGGSSYHDCYIQEWDGAKWVGSADSDDQYDC